jgi:transposase
LIFTKDSATISPCNCMSASTTSPSSNATPSVDPAKLPDDPATLKEMLAKVLAEHQQVVVERQQIMAEYKKECLLNAQLQHRLEMLLRQHYGRKSEALDWESGLFSKEAIEAVLAAVRDSGNIPTTKETIFYERKKPEKKGHGRQELPANLPRVRHVIDIPEEEKVCSVCGTQKLRIREEITEQLEYVPASLRVNQFVRPVYACPQKHEISIAPKPSMPIDKCLAGPELLAHIAVSKYGDHLPLNRQENIFSRYGVHISRSTQCDWMRNTAKMMYFLYQLMRMTVLASRVVNTDDTPITVLLDKLTCKGRAWGYIDPIRMIAVFDFTLTRSRDGPKKFLGNFSGYLQADAYAGYDCIYANKTVTEVACWAHARRKFYDAQKVQPEAAFAAMAWIKRLYEVEHLADAYREAQDPALPEEERRALYVKKRYELRQEHSTQLLPQIGAWLEEQAKVILPKSPVGEAIAYTRSNWAALNVYVTDGDLSIDNNIAERAMRHAAVGRKNWLFMGSEKGGETWAILSSLLYTAKLHELNLFAYMKDVIERIGDTPISELEQFLPDVWKKAHIKAAPSSEDAPAANP